MNEHRFLNRHQPQTLYSACVLGYIHAFFGLLRVHPLLLMVAVGLAAGCYGIANEKKWGYNVAVSAAVLQVLISLAWYGSDNFTNLGLLIGFLFDGALVALLVHPMSRDYQRIWFR